MQRNVTVDKQKKKTKPTTTTAEVGACACVSSSERQPGTQPVALGLTVVARAQRRGHAVRQPPFQLAADHAVGAGGRADRRQPAGEHAERHRGGRHRPRPVHVEHDAGLQPVAVVPVPRQLDGARRRVRLGAQQVRGPGVTGHQGRPERGGPAACSRETQLGAQRQPASHGLRRRKK